MDTGLYTAKASTKSRTADPGYDIADFARKHGLSAVRAKEILDRAGGSREYADLLAQRQKPVDFRDL